MSLKENDIAMEAEAIIANLTSGQEEVLKGIHAQTYFGTDDDMPEAYENWLSGLSPEELKDYLKINV